MANSIASDDVLPTLAELWTEDTRLLQRHIFYAPCRPATGGALLR